MEGNATLMPSPVGRRNRYFRMARKAGRNRWIHVPVSQFSVLEGKRLATSRGSLRAAPVSQERQAAPRFSSSPRMRPGCARIDQGRRTYDDDLLSAYNGFRVPVANKRSAVGEVGTCAKLMSNPGKAIPSC